MLEEKLPVWQDKCSDATKVPDTVMTMIEGLRTPVSMTPDASPLMERLARVSPLHKEPAEPPLTPLHCTSQRLTDLCHELVILSCLILLG